MLASRGMAIVTIAWAALAMVASSVPGAPTPLRVAVNAPLTVLLPGLAWMSLLRPVGLDLATRLVLSVACSLMIVMLVGLALNWTEPGLTAPAWSVGLGLLTLLPALVRLRGGESPAALPRVPARALLLIVPWSVAIVGVVLAHDLALRSSLTRRDAGFTQLWLVDDNTQCSGDLRMGFASYELNTTGFRLAVSVDQEPVDERYWPAVEPGQRWEATFVPARAATQLVEARLTRDDRPDVPYRLVRLDCGRGKASLEGYSP
jgi:hypothetical protein